MTRLDRPPRLLHVVASLDTGGTEMWALRLLEYWQATLEQRVVALTRASGALEQQFAARAPLRILSDEPADAGAMRASTLVRMIRRSMTDFIPDAVLIHTFGVQHLAIALAARSRGIARIAASAGNPPPLDRIGRVKWAAILLGARTIGCPVAGGSEAVHRGLQDLGVGMPNGSSAIPYGVAVPRAPARRDRPMRDLAMVSRLDAIKDHATLLDAFAIVVGTMPDARLTLIGDGPLRAMLEQRAATLGIADRVRFLGRRTDVADLLDRTDLFVFSTTRDEGFGIVLIEAMAKRLPIVASDVPACREVLDGGRAGVLVTAADPSAMAAAILALLADPAAAADVAARGHARVVAHYSVAAAAARWLTVLKLDRLLERTA